MAVNFINDNENGKNIPVLGYWVSDTKLTGAAIAVPGYEIFRVYSDSEGNYHVSRDSIGPMVNAEDLEKGVIKTPTETWRLVRF